MEVSKLEISNELRHQRKGYTEILLWMKDHPKLYKRESTIGIAKKIGLSSDFDCGMTTGAIDAAIRNLIKRGLIWRENRGRWRYDFMPAFGHPDMPAVVDNGVVETTYNSEGEDMNENFNAKTAKVVEANGGKSLAEIIIEWIGKHPLEARGTTASEIAKMIISDGVVAKPESIITIIGREARRGDIIRIKDSTNERRWTFALPKNELTSPEPTIEEYKEAQKIEEPVILNRAEPVLVEEPVVAQPTATNIEIPDGKTISLTINITIGK